jgi:hypothetical protein
MSSASPIEKALGGMKLKFKGVTPTIIRKAAIDFDPKIVITQYSHAPTVEVVGNDLVVTAGSCGADAPAAPGPAPPPAPVTATTDGPEEVSSGLSYNPSIVALTAATLAVVKRSPALGLSAGVLAAVSARAGAEDCSAAMEVEIYAEVTQADVDAWVSKKFKTGQYRDCPAESVYHEFHPETAWKGYKGCAGDAGLIPCAQDGFGGLSTQKSLMKPYEFDMDTGTCTKTNRTFADSIYWILWGLPMDTHEMVKRTGMNPVVYFPLERGSYPSHGWGGSHGDEAVDAKPIDDEWQVYLGAFTKSEMATYKTTLTEGTESGMVMAYAAMMIKIAKTSCNRQIYLLVQAPTYGYSMGTAVTWANNRKSQFLNHSSCSCFATDTCKDGTITLTRVGWFPGQDLPKRAGDDGVMYDGASTSDKSPWFERMVWPENPTGETRQAMGPTSRLVCDGCYVFPPYFPGGKAPIATKPACAAWAFSLTKAYSATIRTGTMLTLKDDPISDAIDDVASEVHNIGNGLYSEWSWKGQNQIKKMLMASGPITSPTSWMGAYTQLMKEKWDLLVDAAKDCPIVELVNGPANTGAYLWWKKKGEYRCLNKGWKDSFFRDCVGVETTSYNFGFRGTTASDYYGEGYCNDDFTRIQLYRDISVYAEVAKRLKTVCSGGAVSHAMGTFLTAAEWKASKSARLRRLKAGVAEPATVEDRVGHLMEDVPRLTHPEAKLLSQREHETEEIQKKLDAECEPLGYPMDCLFKHTGYNKPDIAIEIH